MRTKNQNQNHEPFTNESYFDQEVEYLRLRLARIEVDRRLADAERECTESPDHRPSRAAGVPELRGALHALAYQEQQARDEIDACLEAHRSSDQPELGLDRLCREFDLSAEERLLVLALAVPAISKELADVVLREQGGFCGRATVTELCQVLSPRNVADWLRTRAYFRPTAPMLKHGLVFLDSFGRRSAAETLLSTGVELSLKAFGIIFNDPEAEDEVPPDNSQSE